ncbi:hypothetical protein Tco_0710537 [Tanacetum coccineum]
MTHRLVRPAGDPWDQRVCSQLIGKDLVSGLLVYELPLNIIMEYLMKISKKARILELKRRHLKITVLTSDTPYPSKKIRCICACTTLKTTKEQDPIRRVASEWFKKDCIGSFTTWENLVEKFIKKFYQLSDDHEETETDEDDDPDDIVEIFKIKDHKWYDELTDGKLKEEVLMHKARIEKSWGDATPGVMKCEWLKNNFENFHELDYDVLVKLDYGSNNAGNIQDNMKEYYNPSICKIRRFKMMKYSFDADDEYVAIKEREHSRTDIDACQAYRELFLIMNGGWFMTKA